MKHLLILISFLLLSSTLFGQETGVLYQYDTSSGIQWKTFGDGKVQPKYKGEIKNGKMDGLGVLIYPYGEKSVVGEWKNGKEWNTKNTDKDGKLIGKWVNGEKIFSLLFYCGLTEYFWTDKIKNLEKGDYKTNRIQRRTWTETLRGCTSNYFYNIYIGEVKSKKNTSSYPISFPKGIQYFPHGKGTQWSFFKNDNNIDYVRTNKTVGEEWKEGFYNGRVTKFQYDWNQGSVSIQTDKILYIYHSHWVDYKLKDLTMKDLDGKIFRKFVNGSMKCEVKTWDEEKNWKCN